MCLLRTWTDLSHTLERPFSRTGPLHGGMLLPVETDTILSSLRSNLIHTHAPAPYRPAARSGPSLSRFLPVAPSVLACVYMYASYLLGLLPTGSGVLHTHTHMSSIQVRPPVLGVPWTHDDPRCFLVVRRHRRVAGAQLVHPPAEGDTPAQTPFGSNQCGTERGVPAGAATASRVTAQIAVVVHNELECRHLPRKHP